MEGRVMDIKLSLTRDQALVLFGFISRMESESGWRFEHPAEEKVVWAIEGQLESTLVMPLAPDYRKLLSDARVRVDTSWSAGSSD
jgi:hypothetical protein